MPRLCPAVGSDTRKGGHGKGPGRDDRRPRGNAMIRPALPEDTPALRALTAATGVFKPYEIDVLEEVLDDYHSGRAGTEHVCVVDVRDGKIVGYAYYAP